MAASSPSSRKLRRPKPVNFGKRRTVRLGEDEERAVSAMQAALAKVRGVDATKIDFSEALRLLLGENEKSARILAGQPEAWSQPATVTIPDELWDGLTACQRALSHSQGSLYVILRKLNFGDDLTKDEVVAAFDAVQESKAAVARMEAALEAFLTGEPIAAAAEIGVEAA